MADESIHPFKIAIPDAALEDLKSRLEKTRFPGSIEHQPSDLSGSSLFMPPTAKSSQASTSGATAASAPEMLLGSPLTKIQHLTSYWASNYNWRQAEAKLNELPQFKTKIAATGFEALDVHFIHVKSERKDAIPLVFVHGWPGSFLEATKIIRGLTEGGEGEQSFHVVVPSLPGYGFSEAPKRVGFGVDQHAETFHKLMLRLGYDEYVTQGGDWGYLITRAMGRHFAPKYIKAQHVNMAYYPQPSFLRNPTSALRTMISAFVTGFSEKDKAGFERVQWFRNQGNGYYQIQATKPQTLGYGLADSPAALLAWIYEKLIDWTDAYPWTDDEICTWVSIYWFSEAGPRSAHQLYYETRRNEEEIWRKAKQDQGILVSSGDDLQAYQNVKVGLSRFPRDVVVLPTHWGHALGNVVFEKDHEKGGHFAAWECPDLLMGDLRAMFGSKGGARGVIKAGAKL
ncbi:microsomal epoxide hydrolase [Xylariaceae sp. FL0255]|nr:microsomal epoxide hydrolase [Xylariaceae sp. FL0255]